MEISYGAPMRLAWARMQRMLFAPFALERWFVLGFAAFLSEWMTGGFGNGGGTRWSTHDHVGRRVVERVRDVLTDPVWLPVIVGVGLAALALALLFQWIGSRGKFVFLDGVARERHAITAPWREYAAQGNSLFLWRLVFWLVTVAVIVVAMLPLFGVMLEFAREERFELLFVGPALLGVVALIAIGFAAGFTLLMLDAFVVPLMYRHRLSATAAWARFMPVLSARWPAFVLYALLVLVLYAVLVAVVTTFGLATCCVGFFLVITPYIGQVVLLPAHVFFRALGPEFLRQFGPEFDALAAPGAGEAPPAPGGGA